jgi:hypothetical protein
MLKQDLGNHKNKQLFSNMAEINGYELSRNWWDWCFENPEKISPNHSAIFFFAIEHCNRLGWKSKFGFPTQMAMDAIGIKKHDTYIKYFNDIIEWGFFRLVQKSQNQYSANIISLHVAHPKNGLALGKAIRNHGGKQPGGTGVGIGESNAESNPESNRSIDKPITNNLKPITYYRQFLHLKISFEENEELKKLGYTQKEVDSIFDKIENYKKNTSYKSLFLTAKNWLEKEKSSAKKENETGNKFTNTANAAVDIATQHGWLTPDNTGKGNS